jgi:hypothetical protein
VIFPANILAADTDTEGLIRVMVLVVIALIAAIAKWLNRRASQGGASARSAPRENEDEEGTFTAARPSAPPPPPTPPPPPPRAAPSPGTLWAGQAPPRGRMAAAPARAPLPAGPRAPRPGPGTGGDLAERVDSEMLAQQERLHRQDEARGQRMGALHVAVAEGPAMPELLAVPMSLEAPTALTLSGSELGPLLKITDPQQLKTAIILHEIFQTAKALREEGREMWDR